MPRLNCFAPIRVIALAVLLGALAGRVAAEDVKAPMVKRPRLQPVREVGTSLVDVAEVEPNDSPKLAQVVVCGGGLGPAALANPPAARDTDWIAFQADAGTLVTFETAKYAPADPEVDTFISLIAPDGTTVLANSDDDGTTVFSRIAGFSIPATGLYYGRIRGFLGAEGPYRASLTCASPPPPPVNDGCGGAIAIGCGTITLSGSTAGATNGYDLCPGEPACPTSCTGFFSPGVDLVYRLDAPVGAVLDVTYDLDPPQTDASLYVVTDCAAVHDSCVAGQDSQNGTPAERLVYTFTRAGTYYLILDSYGTGAAAFTLNGVLDCSSPTRAMTWGRVKSIYR